MCVPFVLGQMLDCVLGLSSLTVCAICVHCAKTTTAAPVPAHLAGWLDMLVPAGI